MPRICLVHAADLHLDTPFEGIAGPAPHVAEALREASLAAWDDLVRFTIDREAPRSAARGRPLRRRASAACARRSASCTAAATSPEAGVQTFIVHGNHDPLDGWSAIREWPRGVRVFGHEEVEVGRRHAWRARPSYVHGISYGRARRQRQPRGALPAGRAPGPTSACCTPMPAAPPTTPPTPPARSRSSGGRHGLLGAWPHPQASVPAQRRSLDRLPREPSGTQSEGLARRAPRAPTSSRSTRILWPSMPRSSIPWTGCASRRAHTTSPGTSTSLLSTQGCATASRRCATSTPAAASWRASC